MTETEQALLDVYAYLVNKHPTLKAEIDPSFAFAYSKVVARSKNPPVTEEARLNALWSQQDYILSNLPKVSKEFYEQHKKVVEIEHQVGRFLNMRAIANEIISSGIEGDIVEFGTWQGLGLSMIASCFVGDTTKRRFIGVDSFQGLPETSTVWDKGQFDNTSYDLAKKNIERHLAPDQPFTLIKGWFSDKTVSEELWKTCSSVALVHFDADLASSTTQALSLIEPYLENRVKPIYFLFDDWACHPDEVPDAFIDWLSEAEKKFNLKVKKISTTRLTRNYIITFGAV